MLHGFTLQPRALREDQKVLRTRTMQTNIRFGQVVTASTRVSHGFVESETTAKRPTGKPKPEL